MNFFQTDRYHITFPDYYKYEITVCKSYYAIDFILPFEKYAIVNNFHLGDRLVVDKENDIYMHLNGEVIHKDLPFKPDTFHFLPEDIKVFHYKD
jgi:hypothetical protein